jgi:hypothetical protein
VTTFVLTGVFLRRAKAEMTTVTFVVCHLCVYMRAHVRDICNKLPDDLAALVSNKKCFLLQLKKYLTDKSFYSVEECFECVIDL